MQINSNRKEESGKMFRLSIMLIITGIFNCVDLAVTQQMAYAQNFKEIQWGIDRNLTPSPVCIMNGPVCMGQIGTLNTGTGIWSGGGATIPFTQSGTGAILRTVDAKLVEQPITPQDYGALCNSNGTTGNGANDSSAFNNMLAAAVSSGRPIELPPGICRIGSALTTLTAGVKILGMGEDMTSNIVNDTTLVPTAKGSWLYFDHTGKGLAFEDNPTTITTINSVEIRNVGILRNQAAYTSGVGSWTPTVNDWSLWFHGVDVKLSGVLDFNSTKGIYHDIGRFESHNLRSGAHQIAIQLSHNYDSPVIDNTRIWPFGSGPYTDVRNYRWANLEGIILGRVDAPRIRQVQCTFCHSMFKFIQEALESGGVFPAGAVTNALFTDTYADGVTLPIWVDSSVVSNAITAQWQGVSLTASSIAVVGSQLASSCIYIEGLIHWEMNNLVCNGSNNYVAYFNSTGYLGINGFRTEGGWNLGNNGACGFYLGSANANVYIGDGARVLNASFSGTAGCGPGYVWGDPNWNVGRFDMLTIVGTPTFATMNAAVLTKTSESGTAFVRNGVVFGNYNITFDTNNWSATPPTGAFTIPTNLHAPLLASSPLGLSGFSLVTFAAAYLSAVMVGASISPLSSPSNAAVTNWSAANIVLSKTGITLGFNLNYRVY